MAAFSQLHPTADFLGHAQLHAHVAGIYIPNIIKDGLVTGRTDGSYGVSRFVGPQRVVGVQFHFQAGIADTVPDFGARNTFGAHVLVFGAGSGVHSREERHLTIVTDVEKEVIVLDKVVVGPSLHAVAREPGPIGRNRAAIGPPELEIINALLALLRLHGADHGQQQGCFVL